MSSGTRKISSTRSISRLKMYFLSYLLLVILLLSGIGVAVYAIFFDTLRGVVEQSNVNTLQQARDHIDQRLAELQRLSLQLAGNTKLLPYMATKDRYAALQAVKELRSFVSANSFLLDIGVFYADKNKDQIYAGSGIYDTDAFFGRAYPFRNVVSGEVADWLSDVRAPQFYELQQLNNNGAGSTSDTALYVYPTPFDGTKPYETFLYIVNGAEFNKTLSGGIDRFEGIAFIADHNGNLITATSNVENDRFTPEGLKVFMSEASEHAAQSVQTLKLSDDSYSVVRLESASAPWSYYMVVPTGQFLDSVWRTRIVFYLVIAAALLIGAALSFVLAYRNYRPIKRLTAYIRSKSTHTANDQTTDEFGWISAAVTEMASENSSLRFRLQTKAAKLKDTVLFDIFKGSMHTVEEISDPLAEAGLKLEDGAGYTVLLVVIDGYRSFEQTNSLMMQNLLKYSIINVAEEILQEAGYGYGIDLGGDRGIAILTALHKKGASVEKAAVSGGNGEPQDDLQQALNMAADKIRHFFEENFPFTVTIGVSGRFDTLLQVPTYYRHAIKAVEDRFYRGHNTVIVYTPPTAALELPSDLGHEMGMQLVQAIRLGNAAEIADIVPQEIDVIAAYAATVSVMRTRCRQLMDMVCKERTRLLPSGEAAERLAVDESMLRLFSFETRLQCELALIRYCVAFADEMQAKKESKNFELRDKLLAYVDLHYVNDTLGLNAIAEAVGVSPSYISRYFKNQTGVAISEYVDSVRMEKARELLQEGNLTVKDVASTVGYSDQTHFTRKFKRKEGVTPQQYKNMHASSEQQ